MARKSLIARQEKKQKLVNRYWEKRQELKKIILDPSVSEEEKVKAIETLNKMPRASSPVQLRNRCELTGRARGYLRKFKLSRLSFREYASKGMIPGITKSSW